MSAFRPVYSIHEISPAHWQRLYRQLTPAGYPFLDYRFLAALEDSQCIGTSPAHPSGWQACYLLSDDDGVIIPCYIKQHSYGEYVFDWSWAEAYQRYGLDYYPKLLWAVPFTPASGPRLLGPASALPQAIAAVEEFSTEQCLSGWHLNFTDPETTRIVQQHVLPATRSGCQFHWFNENYQSFEHYLQQFASRKRKSVRKERQKVRAAGLTTTRSSGSAISAADMQFFYQCYCRTYDKRWSTPYLNEDFFQQLRATMAEKMLLVSVRHDQQPVAAALYFFDDDTLYGRYWGTLHEFDALHFEACYYQGIEFCIEQGLQRFNPGTQGEHKISRGFRPVFTHSFHRLQHPQFQQAVEQFVAEEQEHIRHYHAEAETLLPFRQQEGE